MRAQLGVLLGHVIGTWLALSTAHWFVQTFAPKDTNITCAFCGHKVPMETAATGGIGAVNQAMRMHILGECGTHPMRTVEGELKDARDALKAIYEVTGVMNHALGSSAEASYRHALEQIAERAGRHF